MGFKQSVPPVSLINAERKGLKAIDDDNVKYCHEVGDLCRRMGKQDSHFGIQLPCQLDFILDFFLKSVSPKDAERWRR